MSLDPALKYKYFDNNGDVKVLVDDVISAWERIQNDINATKLEAYEIVLGNISKEIHKRHSNGCNSGGFANVQGTGSAILVGSVQLSDKLNSVISVTEESKAKEDAGYTTYQIETAGEPAAAFSEGGNRQHYLLGSTYSTSFEDINSELMQLEHLTSTFVFATHLLKSLTEDYQISFYPAIDLESMATIVASHELGAHVWGQGYMMGGGSSQAEAHSAFCSGYNSTVCAVRYESNLLNIWKAYTSTGIVFCEGHRQLMLNQLMRKNFEISQ